MRFVIVEISKEFRQHWIFDNIVQIPMSKFLLPIFRFTLIIGQQGPPTAQCCTAMTLRNFGYFYYVRGDYSKAIEYLSKALETFQQCANLCIEGYKM
jgi:tetratricopeptide (TPR) repeat protein